jgi:hypothetical protein
VSRAGRLLVVLVGCLLVGLTPLAYADPPDPLWITGYWDDDDFDNVVIFLLGSAAIRAETPADTRPLRVTVAQVELPDLGGPPSAAVSSVCARAPPRSISVVR